MPAACPSGHAGLTDDVVGGGSWFSFTDDEVEVLVSVEEKEQSTSTRDVSKVFVSDDGKVMLEIGWIGMHFHTYCLAISTDIELSKPASVDAIKAPMKLCSTGPPLRMSHSAVFRRRLATSKQTSTEKREE